MKTLLMALALVFLGLPVGQAGTLDKQLDGKLLRLEKGKLVKLPAGALAGKKYLLFYYSASWCPPCHLFTPVLSERYTKLKAKHPEFELILVGMDYNAADHAAYVRDFSMPFAILAYDEIKNFPVLEKLSGTGIPYLVVTDLDGKELIGRGAKDVRFAGDVWDAFEAMLKGK